MRTLGIALRYWAQLCKLDRQAEGTLPPHSFNLLLVHFFQQEKKPVLPCIHDWLDGSDDVIETYESPVEKLGEWQTRNSMSVAELWIEFFEYYSLGITATDDVVSIRTANGYVRVRPVSFTQFIYSNRDVYILLYAVNYYIVQLLYRNIN
jgi:DNA polymerase sigma